MRSLILASVMIAPMILGNVSNATAQGSPSADQIIRALRPSGPLQSATRGIRPAQPGAVPTAAAPASAATPAPAVSAPIVPLPPAGIPQVAAPTVVPSAPAQQAVAPSIDLTVQFQSGSAELTAEATRTLDQLGQALNSDALAAFRFRIEGHTDTTGSRTANLALSQARASRVAEYLQGKFGVGPARLEPVGRGQEALKVPTPDQTPEPRNRRVQVINIGA
jgi:outer membrane protein OmpA-like peptidoglycan-associated protein